jgi:osmoprotectant transport system substrate-binding protein
MGDQRPLEGLEGQMKRFVVAVTALALLAASVAAFRPPAEACVGKTIFVGRLPGREQEVLAEIFSWMVSERTGTTIQTKSYADSRTMQTALQGADVDLYLEDQGVAMREILGLPVSGNQAELRETVRREYEQRFNLVWLEPWGMTGRSAQVAVAGPAVAATPTLVAPVIRKDTLKKFPALSRLVNKLSGVIDNATLAKLAQESERRPAREVAKQFLKEKRLI